ALDRATSEILANYAGPICGLVIVVGMFESESGHKTIVTLNTAIREGKLGLHITRMERRFAIGDERQLPDLISDFKRRYPEILDRRRLDVWSYQRPLKPFAMMKMDAGPGELS